MFKWTLVAIGTLAIVLLPWPWPLASEITTVSAGKSTIRYYFRPAGLIGAATKDNPWVYAAIMDTASGHTRVIDVWADTPCDGVQRLSRQIGVSPPQCDDGVFF